jgi:F-type H+-transporting ATPase subunit a
MGTVLELFFYLFSYQIGLELNSMALIEIPNGELAAPTNDINTTVALSLLTSLLTSTRVSVKKRIRLLQTLCVTSRVLLPLTFRRFYKAFIFKFPIIETFLLMSLLLVFLLL